MRGPLVVFGSSLAVIVACSGSDPESAFGSPPDGGSSGGSSGSSGDPDAASTSSSSGSSSGGTNATDCQAAADALCSYFERCLPVLFTLGWADLATCKARATLSCSIDVASPGAGAIDPACTAAVTSASCAGVRSDFSPTCRTTGALANGAVCENDLQCQSGACVHPVGASSPCGTCAARVAENGSCADGARCDWALVCAGGTCKMPSAKNEACTPGSCLSPLKCVAGSCADPLQANATCVSAAGQDDPCDSTKALFCKKPAPASLTGTCTGVKVANTGEACGAVEGSLVACRGDASCKGALGNQKCVAKAADGAACDDALGPGCVDPAECISGKCALPAADRCK